MKIDILPSAVFKHLKRPLWLLSRKLGGGRLQAAVHYRDLGFYGGVFDAPTPKVQPRLPPGFEVLEQSRGLTEVHVYALDYRDVDWLAPYRELGVFVPARFRSRGHPPVEGQFVLALPVTTEEARWTGVENYGFPKIVADVRIASDDGARICTVDHAGQHVLTMRVNAHPTEPGSLRDRNLTVRGDGMVIASTFDSEGELAVDTAPGGVHLELGYHAIADQLRELGVRIESGRAVYAPRRRAVMSVAIEVAPLADATPVERIEGMRIAPTIVSQESRP